jgi:CBS domain-containing protein
MKKGTPVSAIMTKHVITLKTTDNLETAESLFKKHHIRHIPVCSGGKLIGMLSYTDLLRISFADAVYEDEDTVDSMVYNMFSIEQVMAKNLVSVSSNTMVKDVAELLSKREFHAIPVVDDGKLVGMVTTTDLINFLLQQYED